MQHIMIFRLILVGLLSSSVVANGRSMVPTPVASQGLATRAAGPIAVDSVMKIASIRICRPNGEVLISLNPMVNLIMHTLNLYDLLGIMGRTYKLRIDPIALQSIDPWIFFKVARKEQYFSPDPMARLAFYAPTMKRLLSERAYERYPEENLLASLVPAPMDLAMQHMWNRFYRSYWNESFARLLDNFVAMNRSMDWQRILDRMEQLTGIIWSGIMLVFPTEATAESAMAFGKEICIGTLRENDDAGFCHEGLHLLLGERWAQSPRIQQFMSGRNFQDTFWKKDWAGKYEQALVVGLDFHITGSKKRVGQPADESACRYYESCMVSGLYVIAWPMISEYVRKGEGDLEDLMWRLIQAGERQKE